MSAQIPDGLIEFLVAERRRRDLPLTAVARRAGYPDTTIARWEKRVCCPSVEHFADWAAALGFDLTLTRKAP